MCVCVCVCPAREERLQAPVSPYTYYNEWLAQQFLENDALRRQYDEHKRFVCACVRGAG